MSARSGAGRRGWASWLSSVGRGHARDCCGAARSRLLDHDDRFAPTKEGPNRGDGGRGRRVAARRPWQSTPGRLDRPRSARGPLRVCECIGGLRGIPRGDLDVVGWAWWSPRYGGGHVRASERGAVRRACGAGVAGGCRGRGAAVAPAGAPAGGVAGGEPGRAGGRGSPRASGLVVRRAARPGGLVSGDQGGRGPARPPAGRPAPAPGAVALCHGRGGGQRPGVGAAVRRSITPIAGCAAGSA